MSDIPADVVTQAEPGTVAGAPQAGTAGGPDAALLQDLTGVARRVDELAALPLDEHAAAYQEISAQLQAALSGIDAG